MIIIILNLLATSPILSVYHNVGMSAAFFPILIKSRHFLLDID